MRAKHVYQLQTRVVSDAPWHPVTGAHGNKSYIEGWAHGATAALPHHAFRIVEIGEAGFRVVEEFAAAGPVRPA